VVTIDGPNVTAIEPATEPHPGCLGGPSTHIVPGLLDIQLNGAFGGDFADPSADLGQIARGLTRFGVTGFVPTIVTSPAALYAPALQNLRRSPGPLEARALGVHVEGPYISARFPGTHDPPSSGRLIAEARAWLEAATFDT
jgi:N-acetylglucosamine-6-phosphate deacetylase